MSETIINGIDVSECKYYDDGTCCNEDVLALSCDKTDCMYEQLKRLQEENNILKQTIKNKNFVAIVEENKRLQMLSCANCGEKYLSPDGAELYEKNVQLQQENEELEDRCEDYLKQLNTLKPENKLLHKEIKKYKQALEEIREIVSDEIDKTDADDELMQIYGTIYNRCNEVLNGRD